MPSQETFVARPGELIRGGQSVNELATRVGGLPVYPEGCTLPETDVLTCRVCGKQQALLLQAHAPLTADQVEGGQQRRYLYIFGCAAEGCGKQPGCFRALRLVLPSTSSSIAAALDEPEKQKQNAATSAQPSAAMAAAAQPADDWGVSGTDDWGVGGSSDDWGASVADDAAGWGGAASGSASGFDFSDLNAALDAVGTAAAPKTKTKQSGGGCGCGGGGGGGGGGSSTGGKSSSARPAYDAAQRSLPAFHLYAELESQSARGGAGGREEQRLAELMARYEAEAAAATDAAAEAAPNPTAAALAAGVCAPGGSGRGGSEGEPETWGGEGYEEDAVLAPSGAKRADLGAAYLKFCKQLARCPDQCARYSYGGAPLWPAAQPPAQPVPCAACGAPRRFELQLMAPLIHGMAESAQWLAAEGDATVAGGALLPVPDSWEWLTLAVFVCSRGCDTAGSLVEEAVTVANEET